MESYLVAYDITDPRRLRKVARACDGVEAMEMVERGEVEPDIAFIDLHMPRKNGFNLLAAFGCQTEQAFPMVVLTSSTAPTDAIRSRLRGAVRVVTKPDTVEALEQVLALSIEAVCPEAWRSDRRSLTTAPPARPRLRRFPAGATPTIDDVVDH